MYKFYDVKDMYAATPIERLSMLPPSHGDALSYHGFKAEHENMASHMRSARSWMHPVSPTYAALPQPSAEDIAK